MANNDDRLKLDNQLCFPLYAASRLVTRLYTPLLNELDITYPQYLVMLVLWEHPVCSVSDITQKIKLETSTVTPLLKRLEAKGLISRKRSGEDERVVKVSLTEKGQALKTSACLIPERLVQGIGPGYPAQRAMRLKEDLDLLIQVLESENNPD